MITKINKSANSIFSSIIVACFFVRLQSTITTKPRHPVPQSNPASFEIPRQPGCLLETRGFPSPSHEGFGFISGNYVILTL